MPDSTYPVTSRELAERRKEAAPAIHDAFQAFSRQVFADGALPEKTKQLIAVAVAHVTQCPYCIRSHTRLARRRGATEEEVIEAIWVAAEMRAGGAYAHSVIALDALERAAIRHRAETGAGLWTTAGGGQPLSRPGVTDRVVPVALDRAPAMIDGDGRDGDSGADALGRAWGDLAGKVAQPAGGGCRFVHLLRGTSRRAARSNDPGLLRYLAERPRSDAQ